MPDTFLKSLTLAVREEPTKLTPLQRAKSKLIQNLKQQLASAEAMVDGKPFMVPRTITIEEDGVRVRKQVNKPIKTWYWRDLAGQVRFSVRVANKAVEIEKGKTDIIVGKDEDLPETVTKVLKAVEAGELDKVLTAAVAQKTKS